MLEEATILHADCDAFFASVHQRDDPNLRGKPVAVGPGIVMAATYEARRFGVRSAMPAARARDLCPDLVVVSPDFERYTKASRDLFRVFRDISPVSKECRSRKPSWTYVASNTSQDTPWRSRSSCAGGSTRRSDFP